MGRRLATGVCLLVVGCAVDGASVDDEQARTLAPEAPAPGLEALAPSDDAPPAVRGTQAMVPSPRAGIGALPHGQKVMGLTDVELRCYSQTFECHIVNKGSQALQIDGYALTANAGQTPFTTSGTSGWRSVRDAAVATPSQPVAGVLGSGAPNFQELTTPTSSRIAELNASQSGAWNPGAAWSIGKPFNTTAGWSTRISQAHFFVTAAGGTYEAPIAIASLTGTAITHCGTTAGGLGSLAQPSGTYYLQNDIDCNSVSSFTPIVINASAAFELNGNNKVIRNLAINLPETDNVGLFNALTRGYIHHLTIMTKPGGVVGRDGVGILAGGYLNSSCTVEPPFESTEDDDARIEHVLVQGVVRGNNSVGGLIGAASFVSMTSSRSEANVSSISGASGQIGGLVGILHKGFITNSTSSGAISGHSYIGSIIGLNFGVRPPISPNCGIVFGANCAAPASGGQYSGISSTATVIKTGVGATGMVSGSFPDSFMGCARD